MGDHSQIDKWLNDIDKKVFNLVVYYYGDDPSPDIKADLLDKAERFEV